MIKLNIQRFSSTNKTTNYDLSQFVSSDKPSWLNDYNGDMGKIDTAIHTAKTTADGAATAAGNAQTTAEAAQTTANTAVTNAATADGKAVQAQTDIGTLANLTTSAKTSLVAAINETNDKIVTSYSTATNKSYSCSYVNGLNEKYAVNQEIKTGDVYIDGNGVSHDMYRKIITFNLPNSTSTAINTSISNGRLVDFEAYCVLPNDTHVKQLPYYSYANPSLGNVDFDVYLDCSKIDIVTYRDRTGGTGWVIIDYYKTA